MSSSPRGVKPAGIEAGTGDAIQQQEEVGQEEFYNLLHPNLLDPLVDFDFSYAELCGIDTESVQHKRQHQPQPQQQQQQQQHASSSPKLTGRKRSFTQACNWDNLGPKALSEISAGLLAGGGWDIGSNGLPQLSAPALFPQADAAAAAAAAVCGPGPPPLGRPAAKQEVQAMKAAVTATVAGNNPTSAVAAAGCSKGRPRSGATGPGGAGGGEGTGVGGKRPLNPARMERKASREKRRREEVNQKFEQLLQVLEDAEATSGLEPPAAKFGKAAQACINDRRVEVLSRTIKVLKKLLQERRESLAGGAAAAVASFEEGGEPVPRSSRCLAAQRETPALTATAAVAAAAAAVAPADSDSRGTDPAGASIGGDAAGGDKDACNGSLPEPETAAAVAVEAPGATAGAASPAASVVHHVAIPVSGHHMPMMMPPVFPGTPAHAMSTGPHGIAGHHGQPIFIAVPMYMPHGQGMPPHAQAMSQASITEHDTQVPAAAAAPSLPTPSDESTAAAANHSAPSKATAAPGVADNKETTSAPLLVRKEGRAVPAGMGYQMALQMPQFVAQALSADDGDESPTHAVCA